MTATATSDGSPATRQGPTGGASALVGTVPLIRFILRRDRVRIPLWLGGLTAATAASAASFADLYPTEQARAAVIETLNTPAGLAMSGPREYLADYHLGAMMSHQMLGFTAVMVALMSVLLVVRHTRAEEETGRAELVRASVVGRHAHLAAALAAATGVNAALALLLAVAMTGLGLEGVTWSGSLLYGAAHASVGLVFAGLAAITVQITEHPRGAAGMGFAVIGLAYVLRAAGDVAEGGASWLSPIGWAQRTYAYVDDRWWPLLIAVVVTVGLTAAAVALSSRRDVGAGLRQTRPGARRASAVLSTPVGFALRLHRGTLIGFAVGMLILGASYGSILGDAEAMLTDIDLLQEALAEMAGASVIESFVSVVMLVMANITAVYLVLATLRARSEEQAGRAEPVLATGLSRARWAGSHLSVAMVGGAGVMLVAALGLGASGAVVLGDAGLLADVLLAALAYVPALWVTAGVAFALYGLAPRAAILAWVVPVYAFVVGYLGQLLQFPEWTQDLSPFGHVPQLPADEMAVAPLVVLTVLAALLVAGGLAALARRDLTTT